MSLKQPVLIFFSLLCFIILYPALGLSQSTANIPLTNSPDSRWVYYALERLQLAGLLGRVVFNTRPLTRLEAARMVAKALKNPLLEEVKERRGRDYLEPLLEALKREFILELREYGIEDGEAKFYPKKNFFLIDSVEPDFSYFGEPVPFENDEGEDLGDSLALRKQFLLRGDIGNFFSFYAQPILRTERQRGSRDLVFPRLGPTASPHALEDYGRFDVGLKKAYLKLTLLNLELEAGRDSLWWGPGFQGALILSNNAKPFDLVKLSNPRPFNLPWLFHHLGDIKYVWFLTRLEKERAVPEPYFTGMRVNIAPFPGLEIGLNRTILFGGRGNTNNSLRQYWSVFTTEHEKDGPNTIDQRISLDFSLAVPNLDRFLPLAEGLKIYGEFGEESAATSIFSINSFNDGYLVGLYLSNFLLARRVDLRIEYANTAGDSIPGEWYNHGIFKSGYTYEGRIIGHQMGTDAHDFFAMLSCNLPKAWLRLYFDRQERGVRVASSPETENKVGIDLQYYFSPRLSLGFRYEYGRVSNKRFLSGEDESNHNLLLRLRLNFGA